MLEQFVQGWGLTIVKCGLITVVFVFALLHLQRELRWVRSVTDLLGWELIDEPGGKKQPLAGLEVQALRDEAHAVWNATDPAWAQKQVRTWQMRALRLEPALVFWADLLRQLGLLGTVLGLGVSMTYIGDDATKLLGPLGLAVWATVFGVAYSILLTAIFGMKLTSWVDACEKNIEAWDSRRKARPREP